MRTMKSDCVLALDLGSSSVRTALFDLRGRRLVKSTAQVAYQVQYTTDGGAELSPSVVCEAAAKCLRQTLQKRTGSVVAVGTSCLWHGLMGTDANGRPLTPIYTWAESRCRSDAA